MRRTKQLDEILGARGEWSGSGNHVYDTWSSLDLEGHGFPCVAERPWAHRPEGLVIDRVTSPADLAEWEWRSAWGFGGKRPAEGTVIDDHPAAILSDPRMHLYAGRVDGATVCGAMASERAASIGMYAAYTLQIDAEPEYTPHTILNTLEVEANTAVEARIRMQRSGVLSIGVEPRDGVDPTLFAFEIFDDDAGRVHRGKVMPDPAEVHFWPGPFSIRLYDGETELTRQSVSVHSGETTTVTFRP